MVAESNSDACTKPSPLPIQVGPYPPVTTSSAKPRSLPPSRYDLRIRTVALFFFSKLFASRTANSSENSEHRWKQAAA